jgi:hypothetical protein
VACSLQANYTNREATMASEISVHCVAWLAQWIPMAINIAFLDQSHYYFFQAALQLSSRGQVDAVQDPLTIAQKIWECQDSSPGPLNL